MCTQYDFSAVHRNKDGSLGRSFAVLVAEENRHGLQIVCMVDNLVGLTTRPLQTICLNYTSTLLCFVLNDKQFVFEVLRSKHFHKTLRNLAIPAVKLLSTEGNENILRVAPEDWRL